MKFHEWLTKAQAEPELTTAPDLGMLTKEDEAVVLNQLDQLAGRVRGILHHVDESRRQALIETFVRALRSR